MQNMKRNKPRNFFLCMLGAFIYCCGFNVFIVPANLYSGGFVGISQLITSLIKPYIDVPFNLQSVVYFLTDLPLFLVAFKVLGRKMVSLSLVIVAMESAFMAIIPVPETPILSETITSVLCGGCIEGIGTAITFRGFGSSGGTDLLGLMLSEKFENLSVGRVNLAVNFLVYTVAGIRFSVETAIYSLMAEICCSLLIDRFHLQNNLVTANIISDDYEEICHFILEKLDRSCTVINCEGGYTGEPKKMIAAVLSEYEMNILRKWVSDRDPDAFIYVTPSVRVIGEFEKRLS